MGGVVVKGDIAAILRENQGLPILAWVNSEVVCDDDHSSWLGDVTSAEVKEYLLFEQYDSTHTITRDNTEMIEQYLWDWRDTYLGMAGVDEVGSDKEELERQEKEFDAKVKGYIDGLNWQKAIFINVGTPDSAKYVNFPILKRGDGQ